MDSKPFGDNGSAQLDADEAQELAHLICAAQDWPEPARAAELRLLFRQLETRLKFNAPTPSEELGLAFVLTDAGGTERHGEALVRRWLVDREWEILEVR